MDKRTTPEVAPLGGPTKSPVASPQNAEGAWNHYVDGCEKSMENVTAEFLLAGEYAYGEWNQDIGTVAVTKLLLERDPDKIAALLRNVYLDAWMMGNLADRPDLPKVDSPVKTDFQQ